MVLLSAGAALAAGGAYYYYTQHQQPTASSEKGNIDDVRDGYQQRTVANYNATKPVKQYFTPTNGPKYQEDYYGVTEGVASAPKVDLPLELPEGSYPAEFEEYVNKKRATDKRYNKMVKIKGEDVFLKMMWKEWRAKKVAATRPGYVADTINAAQAAIGKRESSKLFSGENFHTYCLENQKQPLLVNKHRNQKRFSPYFNHYDDSAYVATHNSTGFGFGAVSTQGGISKWYHKKSAASSYGTKADVAPPAKTERSGNTVMLPGGYAKIKNRNMRGLLF